MEVESKETKQEEQLPESESEVISSKTSLPYLNSG